MASPSSDRMLSTNQNLMSEHSRTGSAIKQIRQRPDFFTRQSIKRVNAESTSTLEKPNPWVQEMRREKTSRYNEYGYLRYHLSKTELECFSDWKNDFMRLFEYAARPSSYKVPQRLNWIMDRQHVEHVIENWASLPISNEMNSDAWQSLMFSALWSCPDRALALLQISTEDFTPPGYALKDTIHFLAKWQTRQLGRDALSTHTEYLCQFTVAIIDKTPRNHIRLLQNTVFNLIRTASVESVEALYHCLKRNGHQMHRNTLLQMATRLAKIPQNKELALQMAVEAIEDGHADLNSHQWSSLCTSILGLDPDKMKPSDEFSVADAFSVLLEHGFVPNMVNYTAVIRSLSLTGQLEKAWEVFDVMQQHDIRPDSILWSTLLDGAKRSLSASRIESIVEGAAEDNAIDVIFLNDLLFSVLHFCEAETKDNKKAGPGSVPAFGSMLHFYSNIFHLAPLQSLIPVDLSRYLDSSRSLEMPADWQLARQLFPALDRAMSAVPGKLSPTGATLGIMFVAYVKSLSQPINLISLYAYFRQHVSNGSPLVTHFVREKGTFVYDAIIKALCESPGMLRAALDIIGDMLKHTLEERSKLASPAENSTVAATSSPPPPPPPPPPPLHPPPSVYTWSILLNGFISHKEKDPGERILAMMRQHNVEPNIITWNTLIAGHAKNQDVNKTVHSLQRLEAAGYEADDYTLRAFAKLVNREAALRKMEQTIERRKRNAEARTKLLPDANADAGHQL
ncbi:Protein Rf1 [Colletotrichum shisoi]|uniref:Protein Rf1 n=1 Tax=Colletotrichum shisoi TaxID=2078593 RepID=A0A5Q4C6C9_9PEZI|nr:Protein Rf1 [Colletotrichum shisoi]